MGAWGYQPMENDCAMDWLAGQVEQPLAVSIKNTILSYLSDTESDDVKKHEAEAAIALLIDFSAAHSEHKYCAIDIIPLATQDGLWELAIRALSQLRKDEGWIGNWNDRKQKQQILENMVSNIHQLMRT